MVGSSVALAAEHDFSEPKCLGVPHKASPIRYILTISGPTLVVLTGRTFSLF